MSQIASESADQRESGANRPAPPHSRAVAGDAHGDAAVTTVEKLFREGKQPLAQMLYRAASDLAAKGAMFVVTVAAARRLTRGEFAVFAVASTLGWLGAVAADFGLQMHLARSVAQTPLAARALLARWWPVRLVSGAAALALSLALLPWTTAGSAFIWPTFLFLLAYAASGATEFLYYFFRGQGRTDLESTLTLAQRGTMLLLALAALAFRPRVDALALAMLVPAVLGLLAAYWLARSLAAPAPFVPSPSSWRAEAVRDVAPIGLGILLSALYFRIDVFLLQRWSGDDAVAVYNAMFRLVEALRLFPAAVLAVALPMLARAADRRPLTALATPMSLAALAAAGIGWVLAPWLVRALYGEGFAEGVPVLRLLLLSLPLMALNYALTHQLIGWHGHRAYAAICGVALAANLLLNWRLIPAIGMRGAAWSTLWTELVLTLGCLAALRAAKGPRPVAAPAAGLRLEVES